MAVAFRAGLVSELANLNELSPTTLSTALVFSADNTARDAPEGLCCTPSLLMSEVQALLLFPPLRACPAHLEMLEDGSVVIALVEDAVTRLETEDRVEASIPSKNQQ